MSFRIHLRHTGDLKLRFGISHGYFSAKHHNLFFGRFFLAIREKRPNDVPRRFFDLGMGRAQLKNTRLWSTMTKTERYLYINYNPNHFRLEYFLKLIRGTE